MSFFMWVIVAIVVYCAGTVVSCRIVMSQHDEKTWDDLSKEQQGLTIAISFLWPIAAVFFGLILILVGIGSGVEKGCKFLFGTIILPLAGIKPPAERNAKRAKRKLKKIERELQEKTPSTS